MKKIVLGLLLVGVMTAFKNDKPAYRFFNENGKKVKFEKIVKTAEQADVLFIGELHNNPICHWLEFELTQTLYAEKEGNIILGAEMFEADNQLILNEYLNGEITRNNFEDEARLWPNYKTDYKPLLEFAKKKHLPFIATNIPRRYASIVYKHGLNALDSLSPEARSYIAPLPIPYDSTVPCYKDMMSELAAMGHSNPNLPKAQAIKDATMAYNIAGNSKKGKLFIHFNGSYHSDNFQGILWYIKKYKPELKIVTIASVEQSQIDSLNADNKGKGTFILAVPEDMTKTY